MSKPVALVALALIDKPALPIITKLNTRATSRQRAAIDVRGFRLLGASFLACVAPRQGEVCNSCLGVHSITSSTRSFTCQLLAGIAAILLSCCRLRKLHFRFALFLGFEAWCIDFFCWMLAPDGCEFQVAVHSHAKSFLMCPFGGQYILSMLSSRWARLFCELGGLG
jgi:hypothetical protein